MAEDIELIELEETEESNDFNDDSEGYRERLMQDKTVTYKALDDDGKAELGEALSPLLIAYPTTKALKRARVVITLEVEEKISKGSSKAWKKEIRGRVDSIDMNGGKIVIDGHRVKVSEVRRAIVPEVIGDADYRDGGDQEYSDDWNEDAVPCNLSPLQRYEMEQMEKLRMREQDRQTARANRYYESNVAYVDDEEDYGGDDDGRYYGDEDTRPGADQEYDDYYPDYEEKKKDNSEGEQEIKKSRGPKMIGGVVQAPKRKKKKE